MISPAKVPTAPAISDARRSGLGDIFFDNICITKIKDKLEMMKFRKQIQMICKPTLSSNHLRKGN